MMRPSRDSRRAAANGRSPEAEVREMLIQALKQVDTATMRATAEVMRCRPEVRPLGSSGKVLAQDRPR